MTFNLLIALLVLLASWMGYNYWRISKAAKVVDNADFAKLMQKGQIIDLRPAVEFQTKHIIGARNFPKEQFKASLSALRKEKPVLIYENTRGSLVSNAALILKKNGFHEVYTLKYGLNYWDGKVKEKR